MESPVTLKNLCLDNANAFFRAKRSEFIDHGFSDHEAGHNESTVVGIYNMLPWSMQDQAYYIMRHMGVRESKEDPAFISYFESPDKRKKNIRTRQKPGKFLRKFFPWLSDSEIEEYVNFWKEATRVREYELIYSTEESAFLEAYKGKQVRGTQPNYRISSVFQVCSLSDSCMGNKEFSSLPIHPAAAYASGDFSILYAKEKTTGHIGARMVIGRDSGNRLYSQCNSASKVLLAWLEEHKIDPRSNWNGLSFQVIPCKDGYVMPYVDGYSSFDFNGDSITIGDSFSHASTCGYAEFSVLPYCDHCEESVDCNEEDMESAIGMDESEISVCPSCRRRYYSHSSLQGIWIHDSIAHSVDNSVATQDWLDSNNYIYTIDGEYEKESYCILFNGDWFPYYHSDVVLFDGEYYHEDSEELTEAQEAKAKEDEAYETKVTHSFQWVKPLNGRWNERGDYLEYKETTERILRLNYQLDSNNIPQRLPELPGICFESTVSDRERKSDAARILMTIVATN